MRGWFVVAALVGFALYMLTFHTLRTDPEPAPSQVETIDDYIRLMDERNKVLEELIRLEELQFKFESGEAWSA